MTHVHYKFSSKLSYDTVVFDGPHVTLRDLKRQIMDREKLRAGDCDLRITNAQNKEDYEDDECSIPKGSSVIVRRIPIIGVKASKTRKIERTDVQTHHTFGAFKAMDDQNSSRAVPLFSKMANLADVEGTEEDKIKVMMNQCTYDSMNYNKKFGTVLPANYTCYRCGNTGHHIRNCPTSGQDKNFEAPVRIKKSTGIPRSFMVEVDDPNTKGAMLTSCGRYAIPSIDIAAYAVGKKERPPFVSQEEPKPAEEEDPVPEELLCLICHNLLSDAVVIPCCGNSYCDDCIRGALLDSEEHVCPTCSQSDVSPDTLIANKFLRQAVDNFKKERGNAKSLRRGCGASQSQNPTPAASPVPTPPPLTVQSQPQKPHLPTHSQLDPLLHCSLAAETPPLPQVCGAPPTATGPASSATTPSTSLQPVQSHLETPDKEAEEKTCDDSAAAADPSVTVPPKDPADAPSQLIPLVNLTSAVEPASSGPAPRPSRPTTCWDSSSSSSGCPTGGWNESNTQRLPPAASSYPATPPPLFPTPHFQTFLSAQQPLGGYPPGYPPPTPVWTLPNLQGAPISSLCPSTSIPALMPNEWYRHQKKKERSPHGGSSHRRSSGSNSKSLKFKSSRSYSRSSSRSRSRSRSRSQSRSRPHSPYSRRRDFHSRSRSSYSYGYKRSPTPSSSSSPQVGYHSRRKSPSDHRKPSHHGRHNSKKSASSSCNSRKRGERYQREAGGSGGTLAAHLYPPHANPSSSQELDRERYLQWNREYKEWCDKYFSSYVGHFHQLPLPLLNLPPPPPQWGEGDGSRQPSHSNPDSRDRLPGRRKARMDGRSPPTQSSSDSRSPPSRSSCDSRSTPSRSSSDSRSSPSRSSNDSRSPPSQSSSSGRSTASDDLKEGTKDAKQLITKSLENPDTLKPDLNTVKKHEVGRGEESSSPDSPGHCRKDERGRTTGPNACKDATPAKDKASDGLEPVQPLTKPEEHLDKAYERKSREQRDLEMKKGWRRGKYSDSRHDAGRRHKEKPNKESDKLDTDRHPGGGTASYSRSEKNRKRKGEDTERSYFQAENRKGLKTKPALDPRTRKSESPNPFDKQTPTTEKKKERKSCPLVEGDIWEGGISVKPQKKISINISLEGKSITGKTMEETEKAVHGDETFNRGTGIEANEKESSRNVEGMSEENLKADGEAKQKWEKATFRDDWGEIMEKKKEEGEKEDFWRTALTVDEEEDSKRDGMEASKGEEVTNDDRRSASEGKEGQAMGEWFTVTQKERTEGGSPRKENIQIPSGESMSKDDLMEGVIWSLRKEEEEDTVRSKSQGSGNESRHDRPNTTMDDGSSYEDQQETVVKALEEYTQDRAADQEDEVVLIQAPRSKEERDEGVTKVQMDALATFLPLPSVSVTAEATTDREAESEEKRERSAETESDEARATEREKTPIFSSSHRSVAPSSGKDRNDNVSCTDRLGEKRMAVDRRRDEERGRERDRQKESKRSKERTREEEKRREREHSSAQTRNPSSSSSSHSYSHSTSHGSERRDRQRGGSPCPVRKSSGARSRESRTISRATELPDQNTHKSSRDMSLDWKWKDKDQPHYSHHHQDPSGNYRHKDRPAGSHHTPLSHSQGNPSGSELGKPRHDSRVEKEEWMPKQVIKEGKRDGGGRREDEADECEGRRELEEGVGVSSENGREDGRKERKKKQEKEKKEKRPAGSELQEDGEGKKPKHRKMSKQSSDGREEKSGGKAGDRWKEEEDHTKLCSLMLS